MSKSIKDQEKLQQFESSVLPLHGIAIDYAKDHVIMPHSHNNSAQLLYAISGTLLVETQKGRWLIPPNRAIWIAPLEVHTVIMRSHSQVRSLFIKSNVYNKDLLNRCHVINVNPLLRELILASTILPIDYETDDYANLLVCLLLEELKKSPSQNLLLPWPHDARYHNICEYLTHHLSSQRTITQWANELNISSKTFERQFLALTGISFGKWCQQARILYSLEMLSEGLPIIDVALNCGYSSHSAYSAAFKDFFGQSPSNFINNT